MTVTNTSSTAQSSISTSLEPLPPILGLPVELLCHIFSYCQDTSISIRQTCKTFNATQKDLYSKNNILLSNNVRNILLVRDIPTQNPNIEQLFLHWPGNTDLLLQYHNEEKLQNLRSVVFDSLVCI